MLYPLTFEPIFKERIWGGRKLKELYGKALPTKLIDKEDGRWVEINPLNERLVRQDVGARHDAERMRKNEVILGLIFEEARAEMQPEGAGVHFLLRHGQVARADILARIEADLLKPDDLTIERATRFELVINMKTAKALGIKIPKSLLVQANQVIE